MALGGFANNGINLSRLESFFCKRAIQTVMVYS